MEGYETADIAWEERDGSFRKNPRVEREIVRYGRFLARRGVVSNTFGNIAVRVRGDDPRAPGVIYTKCRGVSLEEMRRKDVVVTEVGSNRLLAGKTPPSNGHQMNSAILRHREDVNAVVHTHPDVIIAYFSQLDDRPFRMVSVDTALVLGAPPKVLPREVNLEADPRGIESLLEGTNCLVMPDHGLTTVGTTVSEAYHRHTAFLAEVNRILLAYVAKTCESAAPSFGDDGQTQRLYQLGERIIYGLGTKGVGG